MHRLDIGMIGGIRQHPCDDTALLGHLQTLVDAELFKTGRHVQPSLPVFAMAKL